MTIYLVPCGVSVWDGVRQEQGKPSDESACRTMESRMSGWAGHARAMRDEDVATSWWDRFGATDAVAAFPAWGREVCAETSSVAATSKSPSTVLEDGHRVVLLASDTDVGVAAAMLVATHMARGAEHIAYHTVPAFPAGDAWTHQFASRVVTVVRVAGLDPHSPGGMRDATAGIGRVLRSGYDTAAGQPVEVHLTGGFKSTLLYLLTMTEILRSLDGGTVTAFYVPDGRRAYVDAVPIDLRRFTPEHLSLLRDELIRVRDGCPTGKGTFQGSGWEARSGNPELTAFGTGFLAVLGESVLRRADDGIRS